MAAKRCQLCGEPAWGGGKEVDAPGFPPMLVCRDTRECLKQLLGPDALAEAARVAATMPAPEPDPPNVVRLFPDGPPDENPRAS